MDSPHSSNFSSAITIDRTPQRSLIVQDHQIIYERTSSGRLRGTDEDDLLTAPLAEAVAVYSGSEVDEDDVDGAQILQFFEEPDEEEPKELAVRSNNIWYRDYSTFSATREEFEEEVGPTIEGISPSDLFLQLWDQQLIENIVRETNNYAWQTIVQATESRTGISAKSRLHDWVETTGAEIYRLIAVIILMSTCVRASLEDYWKSDIMGMPEFRTIMSRDRFLLLFRFLHFIDNDTITDRGDESKLAKIKPVIDYLNHKFQRSYKPHRELCIDESLLMWKRHLGWINSYELCDSVTGYVVNIIVYTGRGTTTSKAVWGFTSSTAKIVISLMESYLGKGYTLFMDKFYNSVSLCKFLKSHKTDVVGTLNRRRVDTPEDIKQLQENRMGRGTVVSIHCGDVSIVSWKDVKLVTIVSTYHNDKMVPGQRVGVECIKPKVVQDYKKFMGGGDLKGQKLSSYLLERKRGQKWYIKVFRRLLNISILNSYIIYCANIGSGRKLELRQYRCALAAELCQRFGITGKPRSRSSRNSCARLDKRLDHFPEQMEIEEERTSKAQSKWKRGHCVRCWMLKVRKATSTSCSQCKVFLCLGRCWRDYHKLENI